jgi:hypothetical protein
MIASKRVKKMQLLPEYQVYRTDAYTEGENYENKQKREMEEIKI